MAKPTLNVLEVCHRLALIEGQKENKTARSGERMEKKRGMSLNNVGIILGVLGGAIAVLESSIVLAYTTGSHGLVGLGAAILVLAGAIIVRIGSRLLGAIVMFLVSLIGQLTGGAIGLAISVIIAPPPSPIFNETFAVSGWTALSLVGSVLILLAIWKSRG